MLDSALSHPILETGSDGTIVSAVQTALNKLGYMDKITGYFGSETKNAIENFQKNNNLSVDGIIGSGTWGALLNGNPVAANS